MSRNIPNTVFINIDVAIFILPPQKRHRCELGVKQAVRTGVVLGI